MAFFVQSVPARRAPADARRSVAPAATLEPSIRSARLRVTRRALQLALGALWILDGALQLQPFMLGRGFAAKIILPAASGQPVAVHTPVTWGAHLILTQPAAWDLLFASVQLLIGAGLLFRRSARLAIVVSLAWGTGVWYFGEGLGGLAGGHATFLTGAPGAALLYAVVGLAAWPSLGAGARRALLTARGLRRRLRILAAPAPGDAPARWVGAAWVALWLGFAVLQTLPASRSAAALAGQLSANARVSPGWLAAAERTVALGARHGGAAAIVVAVAVDVAIALAGLGALGGRRARVGLGGRVRRVRRRAVEVSAWGGIAVAFAVWILAQAFGTIPSGMATDPNSGPLVVLLGAALLGATARSEAANTAVHAGAALGSAAGDWLEEERRDGLEVERRDERQDVA